MKGFLKYLVVYVCVFALFAWFFNDAIEPGYERLHWVCLFIFSFFSWIPVIIADIVSHITKNED